MFLNNIPSSFLIRVFFDFKQWIHQSWETTTSIGVNLALGKQNMPGDIKLINNKQIWSSLSMKSLLFKDESNQRILTEDEGCTYLRYNAVCKGKGQILAIIFYFQGLWLCWMYEYTPTSGWTKNYKSED